MNQVEEAIAILERVFAKEQPMERKVFTYKDVEEARWWIGKAGLFYDSQWRADTGQSGYSDELSSLSGSDGSVFVDTEGDSWNYFSPDPITVEKWVPFTAEDWHSFAGMFVTCKAWNDSTCGAMIVHFGKEYISVSSYAVGGILEGDSVMYQELLNDWTFMDGTPCGKKVVG